MTIIQFVLLATPAFALCYMMFVLAKGAAKNGREQDSLSGAEKAFIWIVCLLNPIFAGAMHFYGRGNDLPVKPGMIIFFSPILAGAIFYYGWKKELPLKAKKANRISLCAFAIVCISLLIHNLS
jgi:hypothetical protein